jgi:hypothetical protein
LIILESAAKLQVDDDTKVGDGKAGKKPKSDEMVGL